MISCFLDPPTVLLNHPPKKKKIILIKIRARDLRTCAYDERERMLYILPRYIVLGYMLLYSTLNRAMYSQLNFNVIHEFKSVSFFFFCLPTDPVPTLILSKKHEIDLLWPNNNIKLTQFNIIFFLLSESYLGLEFHPSTLLK